VSVFVSCFDASIFRCVCRRCIFRRDDDASDARLDVSIYARTERVIVEKALAAAKVASVSLFKIASLS